VFVTAAGPPLAYEDPWNATLAERVARLVRRDQRVAYFYERPDAHTFRYRVFNMVEALDARPNLGVSASWFTRADLEHGLDFVDRADLLVVCRTRYDQRIGQLVARARARGLRVLYDIDDLIFDLRYAHLVGDCISRSLRSTEEWDWWCAYIGRLGLTLQLCDGAITTNDYLAARLSEFLRSGHVSVIPNFYNAWQAQVSADIYRRKFGGPIQRDGRLHIGYFSGTNTHARDFALAAGALDRLLEADTRTVLHIVGSLEVPERLRRHAERIRSLPLHDFINLQRLQGEVEIAIAPIQDNVFTNCKSELKFFEAALTGTVVIASPTHTLKDAIADGETGFLAPAHRWDQILTEARALLDGDSDGYRVLAARARNYVELRYAPERQAERIATALFGEKAAPRSDHRTAATAAA
jgi:glycosyltransferase involved in cell wall biosynthesis